MDFENTEFTGNYSVHECAVRIENLTETATDNWTCKLKIDGSLTTFDIQEEAGSKLIVTTI